MARAGRAVIVARKTRRFSRWFSRHCERRIASHFAEVRLFGLDALLDADDARPLIIVSNHVSWWDPVLAIYVAHQLLERDGYALMDSANLRRLPFFRRVGAFGVDLDDPADGAAAVRYAARLLREPSATPRLLWLFPQGSERPARQRPLGFRGGAAAIARLAPDALVVPVALRYEHQEREQPYVYVEVGPALEPMGKEIERSRAAQEGAVEAALARVESAIAEGDIARFERRSSTRPSALARLGQWMLSRVFG